MKKAFDIPTIYERAEQDYAKLKKMVEGCDCSIDQLCYDLGGHNLEDDLFDINFGVICATIVLRDDHYEVLPNVEIWDDENCGCFDYNYYCKGVNNLIKL